MGNAPNTASWQGADGKFYTWVNGKITVSDSGPTQSTAEQYPGATSVRSPFTSAADQVGATGYNTAPAVANAQLDATRSVDQQASIQEAVKSAIAPLSVTGSSVLNQFKPATSNLASPVRLGAAYNNGGLYEESTLTNPAGSVSAGGGAAEASRGQGLVSTYGMDKVIGTTAGYGVRQPSSTPAGQNNYSGAGTGYATPTGSDSPGAKIAEAYKSADPYANASNTGYRTPATPADPYANVKTGSQAAGAKNSNGQYTTDKNQVGDNFMGYGVDSYGKKSIKVNTGTGANYGKSWMWVNI
jgi:hypothetical protein